MERLARTRLAHCLTLGLSTLVLTALVRVAPAQADPTPDDPPMLTAVDDAGVLQSNGDFLWQYEIYTGTKPSLSHWVLGACDDVFNSIVPGSAELAIFPNAASSTAIEFANPDPPTGATGIKFDAAVSEGILATFSFETNQDWAPADVTATLKAGDGFTTTTVIGPSCTLDPHDKPPVTPEPATLALLAMGVLPLLGALRRRRA